MNIRTLEIAGLKPAINSMRNPLNSWARSDSKDTSEGYKIGDADLDLAHRLISAGTEHAKFLRFITVWANIELPLYVWKEMDTYKFIEKNSCSTMHKILSRPLAKEDFEFEEWTEHKENTLIHLNKLITEKKFKEVIQDLPSNYLQKRTIVTNYAELRNIYKQRKNHKLIEWHKVCEWLETLPYSELIIK